MSAPGWPGLGFDPAPGDPAGVGGLVTRLNDTVRRLHETHDVLASVVEQRGTWTGAASKAFAEKLDGLPRYLQDARTSLQRAAGVLGEWQGVLGGLQHRARDLDAEAVAARGQLAGADAAEHQARGNPDFGLVDQQFSAADLPVAQQRVNAAQAALDRAIATTAGLRASLDVLLRQAEALRADHADHARAAADGVRRADDGLAPPEPAWFEQAADWVEEHLGEIGDVAGVVSGIAATLALIPVLTPVMAPIALAAGGVALLAHGADMTVHDKWGQPDAQLTLVADVAGLVPLGGVLKAAGHAADISFHSVVGLTPMASAAVEEGIRALPDAVQEVGAAGSLAKVVAPRVTTAVNHVLPHLTGTVVDAELVAKAMEGAVRTGTQVPTIQDWTDDSQDYGQAKKNAAGVTDEKMIFDWSFKKFAEAAAKAAG